MENVDLKQFRLILTYHGEADKPFYNVTFSVPPLAHCESPFSPLVMIDEHKPQRSSGSFGLRVLQVTRNHRQPERPNDRPAVFAARPNRRSELRRILGWDVGTITRLDGIRKRLTAMPAKRWTNYLDGLAGSEESGKRTGRQRFENDIVDGEDFFRSRSADPDQAASHKRRRSSANLRATSRCHIATIWS